MFLNVILFLKADSHVLLTRSPLKITFPYDLHVLSIPLAFILSQDQTLQLFQFVAKESSVNKILTESPNVVKHNIKNYKNKNLNLKKVTNRLKRKKSPKAMAFGVNMFFGDITKC